MCITTAQGEKCHKFGMSDTCDSVSPAFSEMAAGLSSQGYVPMSSLALSVESSVKFHAHAEKDKICWLSLFLYLSHLGMRSS